MNATHPPSIPEVQTALLAWFAANARDLPWRRTRDPYRILVSEVMLQQTQVDRVVPYYERWLGLFPTVGVLADAPTASVIQAWAGLGYNRRAVNMQATARAVVERFGGDFPRDVETLRTLPGIGPYTSGAIAAFAFEQDVAFIDTNMRRVLHRVFAGPEVPEPVLTDREVTALAAQAVPDGAGWTWNQALIEFGALQCTARKPACVVCPLQGDCQAAASIHAAIQEQARVARGRKAIPFEQTSRYFRGRIVDALRAAPDGLPLNALGPAIRSDFGPGDLPWLVELVEGLARHGLVAVAEERGAYDAKPPAGAEPDGGQLVRLPG